jgi:hypothetical protein
MRCKFFKRGKSVMWSNRFKGPAMQQHATGWHECGVSRVKCTGQSYLRRCDRCHEDCACYCGSNCDLIK